MLLLSVAQTTVEGMYNKLSNYSQRMFKEADVLKADPCICLKGSRQITKNLRRYRRCHDGGSYSTPSKYSVIVIATRYGLHGPGIKSRWGARFSAPVQTGFGVHPASYTMSTGSFQGVKQPGCGVDYLPYLASRVKKE